MKCKGCNKETDSKSGYCGECQMNEMLEAPYREVRGKGHIKKAKP
jgi:hypothetical protein